MGEILQLHIGQCGCQIGANFWERANKRYLESRESPPHNIQSLFEEKAARGKYTPRAIYIDLEDSVINNIKKQSPKTLYSKNSFISGKQGAANNYGEGHYCLGKEIIDEVIDRVRYMSEKCEYLQGIVLQYSVEGGTGAGLGSLIMERLAVDYYKKTKVSFLVNPSPEYKNTVVSPYNAVKTYYVDVEHSTITYMIDNQSLYNLWVANMQSGDPCFHDINTLITSLMSYALPNVYERGPTFAHLATDLVPYPRIHYITPSITLSTPPLLGPCKLLDTCFAPQNYLLSTKNIGKFVVGSILFRGVSDYRYISESKEYIQSQLTLPFAQYIQTPLYLNCSPYPSFPLNTPAPTQTPLISESCCLLGNITGVKGHFERVCRDFDLLYAKRAFVHWFVGCGLESGEMSEIRENAASLIKDYEEISIHTDHSYEEEEGDEY